MKLFCSKFDSDLPPDNIILSELEAQGFEGYIPYTFISDLLAVTKKHYIEIDDDYEFSGYYDSLLQLSESIVINNWLEDTIRLINSISKSHNMRIIEQYCLTSSEINVKSIPFSNNYVFELESIPLSVVQLLDITEDDLIEMTRLPNDVIDILQISFGYGKLVKGKQHIETKDVIMNSFSDIVRVKKFNFVMPWFTHKFALKSYSIESDSTVFKNSSELVLGYFLDCSIVSEKIKLLLKLLGTIVLSYGNKGKITVYSFYGDSYDKITLHETEDIISYFKSPQQLKLFPINNTKAITSIIQNHPGSEIIMIPNVKSDCALPSNNTCKINIISFNGSKYNLKFANLCRKTGGIFLSI